MADTRLARQIGATARAATRRFQLVDAIASGTNEVDGVVLPALRAVTVGQFCQLLKQGDAPALILGPVDTDRLTLTAGGNPAGYVEGSDAFGVFALNIQSPNFVNLVAPNVNVNGRPALTTNTQNMRLQAGRLQGTTNASGEIALTFPVPFGDLPVSVVATRGGTSVDATVTRAAGAGFTASTVTFVCRNAGTLVNAGTVIVEWQALGAA